MFTMEKFDRREDWLNARAKSIGASDASAVLGINPWKGKAQLYREKRNAFLGLPALDSVEPNDDIMRGTKSESHIRELFAIEHPEFIVEDGTNKMLHDEDGFMSCTLDGSITEHDGTKGVLEIKSVHNSTAWSRSPPAYYVAQMLHQLAVTKYSYCLLIARRLCQSCVIESSYRIDYKDVSGDIDKLVEKERAFWFDNVVAGEEPNEFSF